MARQKKKITSSEKSPASIARSSAYVILCGIKYEKDYSQISLAINPLRGDFN